MKWYCRITAPLLLFAATCSPLAAQTNGGGGATAPTTSHGILDANLVLASSPTATPDQVQQAVDGIFALYAFHPDFADNFGFTSQIVASQLAYNTGNYPSLSEANVVTALNNLATTWQLPPYAFTTAAEVRQLHVAFLLAFPQFIASGVVPQAGSPAVHTALSPLEVTLLFCSLVHQKKTHRHYQMTPSQYSAYYGAVHSGQATPTLADHNSDISTSVQSAAANNGAFNLLLQINQVMSDLGVVGGVQ
jgi:hypothetical protein